MLGFNIDLIALLHEALSGDARPAVQKAKDNSNVGVFESGLEMQTSFMLTANAQHNRNKNFLVPVAFVLIRV